MGGKRSRKKKNECTKGHQQKYKKDLVWKKVPILFLFLQYILLQERYLYISIWHKQNMIYSYNYSLKLSVFIVVDEGVN